ncbi:hypothetical protein [Marinitenerispora sediminis]|uniref:hypothetical protein n=1 Tax=Marinitenerispora sediminis TaxID=1931232 RepID=UPI0011C05CCC|nr:hypothetical protein [Marinitenerispora sediminis]
MLKDFRAQVQSEPNRKFAFVARDGHVLAAAVRGLDPDFFQRYCVEVVLSRRIAEQAMVSWERRTQKPFPIGSSLRTHYVKDMTLEYLTSYLRRTGLPVGEPRSAITLVDNGFRGTTQEVLTRLYPQTDFRGAYAFYGASPQDKNVDRKKGYVLHLGVEHWRGGPVEFLPDREDLTFLCNSALWILEDLCPGPKNTAMRITEEGPDQSEEEVWEWWNQPVRIAPQYRDSLVREAMLSAVLLGVAHYARGVDSDAPKVRAGFDDFTRQIRYWITKDRRVDPWLATFFNSFTGRRRCPPEPLALDGVSLRKVLGPRVAGRGNLQETGRPPLPRIESEWRWPQHRGAVRSTRK